jgi:hypothetical protein
MSEAPEGAVAADNFFADHDDDPEALPESVKRVIQVNRRTRDSRKFIAINAEKMSRLRRIRFHYQPSHDGEEQAELWDLMEIKWYAICHNHLPC